MNNHSNPRIVVIGAGPYGLSIAARMAAAGIDFRIFGKPLERWRYQMPKGMFLKSEGCASSLSDPTGRRTLAQYCSDNGIAYGDRTMPVSLDTFTAYALAFQRDLVPGVEDVRVTRVEYSGGNFTVQLGGTEVVNAAGVVVATGLENTSHIPPVLTPLAPELLSHASQHCDLTPFRNKDVTVIGGGQSALEIGALLAEEGAVVRILIRRPWLAWNPRPSGQRRSIYRRLRYPISNLGEGLGLWLYCNAPSLFRHLPDDIRFAKAKSVLGPAGAWWLRDKLDGNLQLLRGHQVNEVHELGGRVRLSVSNEHKDKIELTTDHVIAATGYRYDLRRISFLSESLKSLLETAHSVPLLRSGFEASVPGLYFTGLASAPSFGPGMRFIQGADFTAREVTRHISRSLRRRLPAAVLRTKSPICREA